MFPGSSVRALNTAVVWRGPNWVWIFLLLFFSTLRTTIWVLLEKIIKKKALNSHSHETLPFLLRAIILCEEAA